MSRKTDYGRIFDLKMKCDMCHADQNAVLILRKNKFKYKNREWKAYHRVCFKCARELTRRELYDLGSYWRNVFLMEALLK